MGRKGQALEQIIAKLREEEVALTKGKTVAEGPRLEGGFGPSARLYDFAATGGGNSHSLPAPLPR